MNKYVAKLPNYTKLFKRCWVGSKKGVRFEIRPWPNGKHDLIFLSSMIHDAEFKRSEVRLAEATLTIPLTRDRWERPMPTRRNAQGEYIHLEHIRSVLTFRAVRQVKWKYASDGRSDELMIHSLWVHRSLRHDADDITWTLDGLSWQCQFIADASECGVRLEDEGQ